MCDEKLSSNAVPQKFVDWLLAMGCPAQKVPSVDKVADMCRGQYYMVWRSLMEHVEAKDMIRTKRLRVFCEDMRRCDERDVLHKSNIDVVVPEQLLVWKRQSELKEKVEKASDHVLLVRQDYDQLTEKLTRKATQYNLDQGRLEDARRRAWFLDRLTHELRTKKANLEETMAIAHSLCAVEEDGVQSKLDKCITALRRQSAQPAPAPPPPAASVSVLSNPAASSSLVSNSGDSEFEEQMYALVRCRGDALCSQLYERRAALVAALGHAGARTSPPAKRNTLTAHGVLAHTAALLSTLALEAMKNRIHQKQAHKRLADAVTELSNYLSGEYCELLVMRCEKAHVEARVRALRNLLGELTSRSGVFQSSDEAEPRTTGTTRPISAVDTAIESKRDELRRVIGSLATTERKVQGVRECLAAVFNEFNKDAVQSDNERYRGLQLDMPQESIATLRQFYGERREARHNKVDISLGFELSDCSDTEAGEMNNPNFVDELKMYLKKFNLEKNRKLVLESGEKLWIFETLPSSLGRVHGAWVSRGASCSLAPPGGAAGALRRAAQRGLVRAALRDLASAPDATARPNHVIEIKSQAEEERQTKDKIKKRLRDDLVSLQKINSTLETGERNIKLWSDNLMRKHVSAKRNVDGITYKDYELYYLESCQL